MGGARVSTVAEAGVGGVEVVSERGRPPEPKERRGGNEGPMARIQRRMREARSQKHWGRGHLLIRSSSKRDRIVQHPSEPASVIIRTALSSQRIADGLGSGRCSLFHIVRADSPLCSLLGLGVTPWSRSHVGLDHEREKGKTGRQARPEAEVCPASLGL